MSLDPFFSITPLSPEKYTYNPANADAPYAYANLITWGGFTMYGERSLANQANQDRILLAYDPVPDTDQTITTFNADVYRRCAARIYFRGINVSTLNQYLLMFRLGRQMGSPTAQFFVGTQFVRAEALTQEPYDDVAILLDTPGDNIAVYVTVRLAAPALSHAAHGFYFMGVDGYLL
jgi:hypothetical protein